MGGGDAEAGMRAMSDAIRDFLLGRSVHALDAYPEAHPEKYGVRLDALRKLAKAYDGLIPIGHGDIVYSPADSRPWRSATGLCGSCEHRRTSAERGGPGAPRAQCAADWGVDVWCCYCWALRSDVEPDGGTGAAREPLRVECGPVPPGALGTPDQDGRTSAR